MRASFEVVQTLQERMAALTPPSRRPGASDNGAVEDSVAPANRRQLRKAATIP
jgi:hypothetical protein